MSKRKFTAIVRMLEDKLANAELAREVTQSIQDILDFDPQASTYTGPQMERIRSWRQRKQQETGKSLYELEGGRAAYQRRRASTDKADAAL